MANQLQPTCSITESGVEQRACVDCAATKLGTLLSDGISPGAVARKVRFNRCGHVQQTQYRDEVDYSGHCWRCMRGTLGYLSTVASFAMFGEDRRIGLRLLKLIQKIEWHNRNGEPLRDWTATAAETTE
jgi:hypothetical protein